MMKKTKPILGVLCGIIVVAVVAWQVTAYVLNRQHAQWLACSVQEVRALCAETDWIAGAIETLHTRPKDELGGHFISPNLILMTNGEWIAYRSATHKQGTRFPELFIGYASDKQWYYTTYHFCRQLMVLGADGQPSSLSAFREEYSLATYSDEPFQNLAATWPTEE